MAIALGWLGWEGNSRANIKETLYRNFGADGDLRMATRCHHGSPCGLGLDGPYGQCRLAVTLLQPHRSLSRGGAQWGTPEPGASTPDPCRRLICALHAVGRRRYPCGITFGSGLGAGSKFALIAGLFLARN